MTKEHILAEIRRTAKENGGKPLGRDKFFGETGIKESDWLGKYWVRWSDAIVAAGLKPNDWNIAIDEDVLLEKFIALTRELGRIPLVPEMRMKVRRDPNFPNDRTFFKRFGSKPKLVAKVREYCDIREGYSDIAVLCVVENSETTPQEEEENVDTVENFGYVYLMKAGRHYKIGRSKAVGRREAELAIQLPEKATKVHVIMTDDPSGIEAYWHKRFGAKRKNGEWFELNSSDIKAFKRRKFM